MSSHPYREKVRDCEYPATSVEDQEADVILPSEMPLKDQTTPRRQASPGTESDSQSGSQSGSQAGSVSYPYGNLTPPPIFALPRDRRSHLALPLQNSVSATSSVTNLNLNSVDQNLAHNEYELSHNDPRHLRSESQIFYRGHNRSISSTSSFYHNRNDTGSMVDFSQDLIQQYLGENVSHLVPRMKTIELYRQNAKKLNDPLVLFEYAQYMLQTALLLDDEPASGTPSPKGKKEKQLEDLKVDSCDTKLLRRSLLKEATIYLKKLADKGYVDAQYFLGDAYSSGALGKIDNREAFSLFIAAAKHGHVESAYRTALCLEEGLGTARNARKLIEYLKLAASKNHPAAMYKLGIYSFYSRMGMPNNINTKKSGIKWLERASEVANELTAGAPYELGKIYYYGFEDIIISDKKYGLELYSQAAALGHIRSAALLGQFYEVGEIVPQDSNLSIHYYTQAALGGDPESMLAMCAWYLIGSDPYLPKDDLEAFEWAKRAALCNLPKAQFALANFYDKGIGCTKNEKEAQTWYVRAAECGDENAISRINDKEVVAKLMKKAKKKKPVMVSDPDGPASSALDKTSEKDCVIM